MFVNIMSEDTMRKSACTLAVLLASTSFSAAAYAYGGYVIAGNTSKLALTAHKLADADPSSVISFTVWLKPHNRSALDGLTQSMYDKTSPRFHQWLSRAAFADTFAPDRSEAARVQGFLQSHNLKVTETDRNNLFVRAEGSVAAVSQALHVEMANYSLHGQVYRANSGDPVIDDPAGALVMGIEGLDSLGYAHHLVAPSAVLRQGKPAPATAQGVQPETGAFPSVCFGKTGTKTVTSSDQTVQGSYTGNIYDSAGGVSCGYTPAEVRTAYNLNPIYAAGYDGTGQTIVIVDWCGSPTILKDANAFSSKYGLPALTSANFSIVDYPGTATCGAEDPEINIDVEWAHAIAPGANILLLVPPSPSFSDIDSALLYSVENGLGNVVSNSYGSEEYYTSPSVLQIQNFILEAAAAQGISMDFSSGDSGDFTFDINDPVDFPPSVSAPADSPYATAVGGVSLALTASNAIQFQAGWGTNETLLTETGTVFDGTLNFGFDFGSGGGESIVFAKPSWQAGLRGKGRKVPDISWLADPFTGGIIAISVPDQSPSLIYTVYGGTSLACPMFSALWAIADQAAGVSLGLAAPALYGLASGITDIVPVGSPTNLTSVITSATQGNVRENAKQVVAPIEKSRIFYSALWTYTGEQDTLLALSFGTDSGLTTAPGWDNVTGLGVPDAPAMMSALKAR